MIRLTYQLAWGKILSKNKKEQYEEEEDKECPECGSLDVILHQTRGEYFCQNCGIVVEGKLIFDGSK